MYNNLNYIPLGPWDKEPKEGRFAIQFTLDFSATLTQTVDIGLTGFQLSQLRSIWIANQDLVSNLSALVVRTGQIIRCNATKDVYTPLISIVPCRIVFSVNVLATEQIKVIVANYEFDTIKPNDAVLSASDLTNGVTGAGAIVLANAPTINGVLTVNGNEHVTGSLTVDGSLTVAAISIGGVALHFADAEIPVGAVNGINAAFTLAHNPVSNSLMLFLNGIKMLKGTAYVLVANTITYQAGFIPQVGDVHETHYRY